MFKNTQNRSNTAKFTLKSLKFAQRTESPAEHLANAITHGIGFGLSIACLVLLVVFASLRKGVWEIVSCSVFGATLATLYLASTLYHSIYIPRVWHVLHIVDRSAIYLLIAGTYTPYLLVPLRGGPGWALFGVLWSLAILGIIFQAVCLDRFKIFSVLTYLTMGWLVISAIIPRLHTLPPAGVIWLAAGGLCYMLGVVFYVWKRLPFAHAVWHLFVLAGGLSHFFGILFFVAI